MVLLHDQRRMMVERVRLHDLIARPLMRIASTDEVGVAPVGVVKTLLQLPLGAPGPDVSALPSGRYDGRSDSPAEALGPKRRTAHRDVARTYDGLEPVRCVTCGESALCPRRQ